MSTLECILDIGSTAIRLTVIEPRPDGTWKTLEQAAKSIPLGRDAFSRQKIGSKTITTAVEIILGYLEILKGWDIGPEDVTAIGTSALREASNRETVLDRILVHTGIQVQIIDGVEESRLTFAAVEYALKDVRTVLSRTNSLIIEVGGGSTELMLLKRNRMVAAHSLKIGTIRIKETFRTSFSAEESLFRYITENIRTAKERLDTELELRKVKTFVATGGDVRVAAEHAGEKRGTFYSVIKKENFLSFIEEIKYLSADQIVAKLHIPYNMAELLGNALEIYKLFFEGTSAQEIYIPSLSIREGTILTKLYGKNDAGREQITQQMRASAVSLGRKYLFDEEHSRHVSELCLTLFDYLMKEFKMPREWRIILEISAILHDIGTYINTAGHHKHGQYIIEHSELFGLNSDDLRLVANIVRFHRKKAPTISNSGFRALSHRERIEVMKLAGILRVADALDRGHSGRISDIRFHREPGSLTITPDYEGDLSIEKSSLRSKSDLFEEIFGLEIKLR